MAIPLKESSNLSMSCHKNEPLKLLTSLGRHPLCIVPVPHQMNPWGIPRSASRILAGSWPRCPPSAAAKVRQVRTDEAPTRDSSGRTKTHDQERIEESMEPGTKPNRRKHHFGLCIGQKKYRPDLYTIGLYQFNPDRPNTALATGLQPSCLPLFVDQLRRFAC